VNATEWQRVYERLSDAVARGLDELLTAMMCRGAGKPMRDTLKALMARYQWLELIRLGTIARPNAYFDSLGLPRFGRSGTAQPTACRAYYWEGFETAGDSSKGTNVINEDTK
jgi:hypothetical protein